MAVDNVNASRIPLDSFYTHEWNSTSFGSFKLDGSLSSRQNLNLAQSVRLRAEHSSRFKKDVRHLVSISKTNDLNLVRNTPSDALG